jgi:hypothetical protein
MANKRSTKKRRPAPKTVLHLPDLDQAKAAVLNSLSSQDAQRGYRHAMDEFIEWYCSEPRLSFNVSSFNLSGVKQEFAKHRECKQ